MTLQVKNYISRNRVERASEGNNMLVNVFKKHPHDKVTCTVSEMINMIR